MKITQLVLVAGLVWLGTGDLTAQEYKIAKTSGTLEIKEVNHLTVQGATGNEIIFSVSHPGSDGDNDGRSKGLRAISSQGLEDNTGVGLSAITKGDVVEVRQLKKMDGPEVTISVPKGVAVYFEHTSPYGDDVTFKNIEGKIEISTVHSAVHIENATGPLEIKTVHGEIEAVFATDPKNDVSIASTHGTVDVALPVTAKVNVHAKTNYGEILVDPSFKIEIARTGSMVKYNDGVNGKINGGGTELELSSTHNNVYIRKK